MKSKIALVDVCHTIVYTSTIREFTEHYLLSRKRNLSFRISSWLVHLLWKIVRKFRIISDERFRRHYVGLYRGYSATALAPLAKEYASYLLTIVKKKTLERLHRLQKEGTAIFLVSAGFDLYLNEFARSLGVSLLCTELAVDLKGNYTGQIQGVDAYGEGKIQKCIEEGIIDNVDLSESIAISDHYSDIPMLSLVGKACVVDPDPMLLSIAKEKGWEVIV